MEDTQVGAKVIDKFLLLKKISDATPLNPDTDEATIWADSDGSLKFTNQDGTTDLAGGSSIINIQTYGAVGDGITDNSTFINNAIAACNAAGGGIVFCPSGTYKCLSQIVLLNGVILEGEGVSNTIFDCSEVSDATGAIRAAGTLTLLTTGGVSLATNISAGDKTVTFSSAVGLSTNDIYIVHDTDASSYSAARSYYYAGEYFKVQSISDAVVTNTSRAFSSYTTGGDKQIYKVNPVRCGIRNIQFTFKTGISYAGIYLSLCADTVVENVEATGSRYTMLLLERCYETKVKDCKFYDYQSDSVGLNYGLQVSNCQKILVEGGFFETSRHGIATGGNDKEGSVVNREIIYTNLYCGSVDSTTSHALDIHGNSEHVIITGCNIVGGIDFGGDYISIIGNQIRSGRPGSAIHAVEITGWNVKINNNSITSNYPTQFQTGLIYLRQTSYMIGSGIADISENVLDLKDFTASGGALDGIVVGYDSFVGTSSVGVRIHGNIVTTSYNPGAATYSAYGINIYTGVGHSLTKVIIENNILQNCGIKAEENIQDAIIENNKIFDALGHGLFVGSITSPSLTSQRWTIQNNYIVRSRYAGMWIGTGVEQSLLIRGNTSINNGVIYTASAADDASLYILNCNEAIVEENIFGDTSASPTQQRVWTVVAAGTLWERGNRNVGEGINGLTSVLSATTIYREYYGAATASSFTLRNGGAITDGGTGAVTITASGENQNITLTPSGTGDIILDGAGVASRKVGIGTATPAAKLEVFDTGNCVSLGNTTNTATYVAAAGSRCYWGYGGNDMIIQGASGKGVKILAGNNSFGSGAGIIIDSTGRVSTPTVAQTLAAAATTLAIGGNIVKLTGDAGGNTLATITGGSDGMELILLFIDANITITDTDAATASTINLSAPFTSTANDVLCLVHNGTKWFEKSRSLN